MRELARLSLRGRRGQVVALATTVLFSAVLMGALGLLVETGARGQVETGEYGAAPVLLGAPQSLSVSDDVDATVPGRGLLPASLVEEVTAAMPSSRVVADRIAPATLAGSSGRAVPVSVHPWSAFELGERRLASGRDPASEGEVAVPAHLARENGLKLGDRARLAFGDEAETYTVVGLTTADDTGVDDPDIFLGVAPSGADGRTDDRVAAIGVWPANGDDPAALDRVAERGGARPWNRGERGPIEVVRQGDAKATLVSAAAAFGATAFIVAVFTVVALTGLQIRERSRELAMLRIVGATPKQVKLLLRSEIRRVALVASVPGAIAGPLLGTVLIGLIRSWGVVPRSLQPVFGPLPFVIPVVVGLAAAEIAARIALRRVVRGSPLTHLDAPDENVADRPRTLLRTAVGSTILLVGVAMACAPWYLSGEAAVALPGLSGLVIALSIGPLGPSVVRAAARVMRRTVRRSAAAHLAVSSVRLRSVRVGGALAPIVLGVVLSCSQLLSATTVAAVADDQVGAGRRTDLIVSSLDTGVGRRTEAAIRDVPGVRSADALVATRVVARVEGSDIAWQTLSALGIASDRVGHYADLGRHDGRPPRPRPGEVALGAQGAGVIGAELDDTVTIVLADGRSITRRVTSVYQRDVGFGQVLLPIDDLRPATASGLPSGLALSVADDASVTDVEARIRELLAARPGLEVTRSPVANPPATAPGEAGFQVMLLLIIFGYIAIAVVNSLVVATLSRRPEFAVLRSVGATPLQRRRVPRWEAVFLATTACVVGTVAAFPGLAGVAYGLSGGDRVLPAVDPVVYGVIVALTFGLVLTASALSARRAMRDPEPT